MLANHIKRGRLPALALAGSVCIACTGEPMSQGSADGQSGGESGGGGSGGGNAGGDEMMMGSDESGGGPSEDDALSRTGLAARLSKFEYQNSIFDVLGVTLLPEELDAAAGGLVDDAGDGVFKHLADNQTSVEQHALAYFRVAEGVAARVDIGAVVAREGTCTEPTEDCGGAILQAVGRRLYRRPLDARELEVMLSVYRAALDERLDFEGATRWALVALLQAPQFLFHMADETAGTAGSARELDGYELSARLASFLWLSVPDDTLLSLAADDSLLAPEVLEQQVQRMLADPKAQRFTEVFAIDFSRARFASFEGSTDADRAALNESVVATFQDHFWAQGGSVADLFLTTRFVINPTVAALLGVPSSGTGLEVVDVADLPERVGVMTHPGMIAGMGDRDIGSFVNRGKYLMERLLCRHPTAFPAEITSEIEQFTADTTGLNEHERAEIRMTRTECWFCHRQFEPLAFGFSRFDGAGQYVGESDSDGKPLPLDGWVPTLMADEPQYMDVRSYMEILATEPTVQTCMTEHFINFATARIGDEVVKDEAELVREAYQAAGSTLPAMVSAVAQSEVFRTIRTSPGGL